jgi:prepilin-type N-terminal cleavage/methylation domain-containing protein
MRRRGFTLIEVTVVCAILAMIAALALPSVVGMKANRERRETYNQILRLAQMGREIAVQRGRTYVLSFDGSTKLDLSPEEEQTAMTDTRTVNSNSVSNSVAADTKPLPLPHDIAIGEAQGSRIAAGAQGGDEANGASVDLPSGVSIGQINLGSQSSSTSDFKLHFYADGRSESGGFEMVDGSTTRSLTVDRNGIARLEEGSLPAATADKWEAGQYEQRSSS